MTFESDEREAILEVIAPKIFDHYDGEEIFVTECCERLFVGIVPPEKCATCELPCNVTSYKREDFCS